MTVYWYRVRPNLPYATLYTLHMDIQSPLSIAVGAGAAHDSSHAVEQRQPTAAKQSSAPPYFTSQNKRSSRKRKSTKQVLWGIWILYQNTIAITKRENKVETRETGGPRKPDDIFSCTRHHCRKNPKKITVRSHSRHVHHA